MYALANSDFWLWWMAIELFEAAMHHGSVQYLPVDLECVHLDPLGVLALCIFGPPRHSAFWLLLAG